jgi:hypothetical protein
VDNVQKKINMKNIMANEKKLLNELHRYRGVTFRDFNLAFEDQEAVRLVTEQFVASKYQSLDKPNEE